MLPDSPNWVVMGEPASKAEATALDRFRDLLPEDGITRAWVNLTFIDDSGRTGEIDVLLLTPAGFFLVELKGWHGTIRGTAQRWTLTTRTTRSVENPFLGTDRKAKRLSSMLAGLASGAQRSALPWLTPVVVLHGDGSTVDLDDARARTGIYRLNGYKVGGKQIPQFSELLSRIPSNPRHVVDARRASVTKTLCAKADFVGTRAVRKIGEFDLADSTPLAESRTWQDVLVKHQDTGIAHRLRLYDVPARVSKDERKRIELEALREYQLTQDLDLEGIVTPLMFHNTPDGPALVFRYDEDEVPLDEYLRTHPDLTIDERISLTVRIGEILRRAHASNLMHRTLSPRHVWVKPSTGRVRVSDWSTGRKITSTAGVSTLRAGQSDLTVGLEATDWLYLAPEARNVDVSALPPVPLDVYGFGALAYLAVTDRHPGVNIADLTEALDRDGCLDPSATPGLSDALIRTVQEATAAVAELRTETIRDVLDALDDAVRSVRATSTRVVTTTSDPLNAQPNDEVAERFRILARRGEGSTGVVFQVNDYELDPDRRVILKLAKSDSAARSLRAEAETLALLDHPRVVRLLIEAPVDVEGRAGLVLSDAGQRTLADRLQSTGRATITELEQLGQDLLEAVLHLGERGVFHRDIKPDNLGVRTGGGRTRLTLFDFSLSREGLDKITAGTPGYRDPYLGKGRRRRFDLHAELWSVAATLFEMATADRVWWAGGAGTAPSSPDEAPAIETGAFEPRVAVALAAFFTKALAPDAKDRFDGVEDFARAWREVFAGVARSDDGASLGDEEKVGRATAETSLEFSGLSARALSALHRLDQTRPVETVGDLLRIPTFKINRLPGIGEADRKEILRALTRWRASAPGAEDSTGLTGTARGVEAVLETVLEQVREEDREAVAAVLGTAEGIDTDSGESAWMTSTAVHTLLGVNRDDLTAIMDTAVEVWTRGGRRRRGPVAELVEEVVALLGSSGRMLAVHQVAAAVLARHGSTMDPQTRLRNATALVRVVFEIDKRADEPRLAAQAQAGSVPPLLALTDNVTGDEGEAAVLDAALLFRAADRLGEQADELVTDGQVLPLAEATLRLREQARLRLAVELPASDEQLLRLAAAVSRTAAVSGVGELYPTDLDSVTAVRHALRGRPGRSITDEWVGRRVTARFGKLSDPLPKRPHLDEIVTEAVPGLVWEQSLGMYVPQATLRRSTPSVHTATRSEAPEAVHRRLRSSIQTRSANVLCVHPRQHAEAVDALETEYGVRVVDVARIARDAARQYAEQRRVSWPVALKADGEDRTAIGWARVTRLMTEAVAPAWSDLMADNDPLLLIHVGPLLRYGMANVLSTLLDAATPRPAARWILVAHEGTRPVPALEGIELPMGTDRRVDLPAGFAATPAALLTRTATGA